MTVPGIPTGEQISGLAETSWFVATSTIEGKAKFQSEISECKDVIFPGSQSFLILSGLVSQREKINTWQT